LPAEWDLTRILAFEDLVYIDGGMANSSRMSNPYDFTPPTVWVKRGEMFARSEIDNNPQSNSGFRRSGDHQRIYPMLFKTAAASRDGVTSLVSHIKY
jgi:hypothetical protein